MIFSECIRLGLKRGRGLTDGLFVVHLSPFRQQTGVVQYVQMRRDRVLSTSPNGKKFWFCSYIKVSDLELYWLWTQTWN